MAYKRKTRDLYELQIKYGADGFETVSASYSRKEMVRDRKSYEENEPGYERRIVKKREPILNTTTGGE